MTMEDVNNKKYGDIFLMMYKSNRKNSKGEMIPIHELITHGENLTDDRILSQIVNALDSVVAQSKKYNDILILSANVFVVREVKKKVIMGECLYNDDLSYHFQKKQYYSIEQVINFIYYSVMLMYSYCKLSLADVYDNPSILYFVNKYYH